MNNNNIKLWVGSLAAGAAFFASLADWEGFQSKPYQDSGGVPTIGIGSTQYPDGKRVTMNDPPITRQEAEIIAKAHIARDEQRFQSSLHGVKLSQMEYDVYLDFVYQFGQGAWARSSMRRALLRGEHLQACQHLLKWRFVGKTDCSVRNSGCYGVWRRQLWRHDTCMTANVAVQAASE